MVTRKGRIARANHRAVALLGRTPGELEQIPLAAFVPPEDIDLVMSRLWAYLRGEQPLTLVAAIRQHDGQIRSLEVSGRVLPEGHWCNCACMIGARSSRRERDYSNRASQRLLGFEAQQLRARFWAFTLVAKGRNRKWPGSPTREGRAFLAEFRVSRRSDLKRIFLVIRDLSPFRQARQELHDLREKERAVLGQELHDDLGQVLTALSFLAESLACRLEGQAPETSELARQVTRLANESNGKTRALARGLYPVLLDRSGLSGALQDLAATTEEIYGVRCRLLADPLELDRRLALYFFRIAQEAVTNAAKHSGGSELEFRVQADEKRVWMEVRDNGCGMVAKVAPGQGLGLRSMRQHAELMEGGLELESMPGGGTSVVCWAPRGC